MARSLVLSPGNAGTPFRVEHPDRPVHVWVCQDDYTPLTDAEVEVCIVNEDASSTPLLMKDWVTERNAILSAANGYNIAISVPGTYVLRLGSGEYTDEVLGYVEMP